MDVVALLLAPDPDDLRHDARQVGVHDSAIQGGIGTFGDEIENADAKSAHENLWAVQAIFSRTGGMMAPDKRRDNVKNVRKS
jgi:hypothetical protein